MHLEVFFAKKRPPSSFFAWRKYIFPVFPASATTHSIVAFVEVASDYNAEGGSSCTHSRSSVLDDDSVRFPDKKTAAVDHASTESHTWETTCRFPSFCQKERFVV